MSLDPSEELMSKYADAPRKPRRLWPWLLGTFWITATVTAFMVDHVRGSTKPQISAEDCLTIINAQQKIHNIQEKFQAEFDKLKKQADAEAAPYFKASNEIQVKVCKSAGFTPDCQIDVLAQTVKAKATPPPAPAPSK